MSLPPAEKEKCIIYHLQLVERRYQVICLLRFHLIGSFSLQFESYGKYFPPFCIQATIFFVAKFVHVLSEKEVRLSSYCLITFGGP